MNYYYYYYYFTQSLKFIAHILKVYLTELILIHFCTILLVYENLSAAWEVCQSRVACEMWLNDGSAVTQIRSYQRRKKVDFCRQRANIQIGSDSTYFPCEWKEWLTWVLSLQSPLRHIWHIQDSTLFKMHTKWSKINFHFVYMRRWNVERGRVNIHLRNQLNWRRLSTSLK